MQQNLAAAERRLGIGCGFQQQLFAYLLLGQRFTLHELLEFLQVFVDIKCYTLAFTSVTTGTSRLLIVALEALGYIVVYDIAHIGFVDAHAKGYRGDDNVDLFQQECVLVLRTGSRVHTGMVGQRPYPVHLQ